MFSEGVETRFVGADTPTSSLRPRRLSQRVCSRAGKPTVPQARQGRLEAREKLSVVHSVVHPRAELGAFQWMWAFGPVFVSGFVRLELYIQRTWAEFEGLDS